MKVRLVKGELCVYMETDFEESFMDEYFEFKRGEGSKTLKAEKVSTNAFVIWKGGKR